LVGSRRRSAGRSFEKTLRFSDGYLVGIHVSCRGSRLPFAVTLGPGLRNLSDQERENRFTNASGAVYFDGERARPVSRQKVESVQQGPLPKSGFVGLEDNYFLEVLAPKEESQWWIAPARETQSGKKEEQVRAGAVAVSDLDASLYAGPKDLDVMAALGLHLEETVSFRTMGVNLGWIAKGLIWLLKASHRYVANWGVAILMVTFLVRLVLFPLVQKSFVGMKKMQKLQPKINVIRDKYKKAKMDVEQRNKMNQEMMALYSAEVQPDERVSSDAPPDADPVRVLRDPPAFHRAAARAVRLLDPRPVRQGPDLHPARADDRFDVPAAADDAVDRRRRAAQALPHDAALLGILHEGHAGGARALLAFSNVLTIGQQA
jgi:hypothetical protein